MVEVGAAGVAGDLPLAAFDDIDAQAYPRAPRAWCACNSASSRARISTRSAFESVDNKRRILDALIDEQLMKLAAERDGIVIGDVAVRDAIQKFPDFQVDGKFNAERYQLVLASQIPAADSARLRGAHPRKPEERADPAPASPVPPSSPMPSWIA